MNPGEYPLERHLSDRIEFKDKVVFVGFSGATQPEQVFDSPTRLGMPDARYFGGLVEQLRSPEWAAACGLALGSMRQQLREYHYGGRGQSGKVAAWIENFREKFR